MKSHVGAMLRVYDALFTDVIYALPKLGVSLSKDLEHIRLTAASRGVSTLVVDLPFIGKHLDKCLSKGFWAPISAPLLGQSRKSVLPKFLGGLLSEIFEETGCLKDTPNLEAIIFARQILYLCKKVPLSFSDQALKTSVQKLISEDALLPKPEQFWLEEKSSSCLARVTYSGFRLSRYLRSKDLWKSNNCSASGVLRVLDKVSKYLCSALGSYDPREWQLRHGPGAISQTTGPTNKYNWYGWSARLESVFPVADYGFHNLLSWAGSTYSIGVHDEYVPVSRLVAVPKTYETPRLIAAEPSENQWCQQNIWHYFKVRSAMSWIGQFVRFTDQQLNQELCRKGSLDGSLCTVDLSSASDRVSCHVVGNFFRSNLGLLDALRASRTHYLKQRLDQSLPTRLELNKFSTMGSACTFPVETMIFLGICLTVALIKAREHKEREDPSHEFSRHWPQQADVLDLIGQVAVFGDDLIVPTDCRELLQGTLELLDFKVNESKSFAEGNFRESCGLDAFRGVDVTPVYLRHLAAENPGSTVSLVDTANHFYDYFYCSVASHLESILPSNILTVSVGSGVLGLHSRLGTRTYSRKRWNKHLMREEVRGITLSSTTETVRQEDDTSLHQYFTERPSPLSEWQAGVRKCPQQKLKLGWVDISEVG